MRIGNHILDRKDVILSMALLFLTACPFDNNCKYKTELFSYLSYKKMAEKDYNLFLSINSKPVDFVLDSSMDITKYGDTLIFKSFKMNLNAGDSVLVAVESGNQRIAECRDLIYGETTLNCEFRFLDINLVENNVMAKYYDGRCMEK